MRQLAVFVLLLMWPLRALADVSGLYASYDSANAVMIHIVEGQDGALHGQIDVFTLGADNQVIRSSRSLAGTARNGSVAMTVNAPLVGLFESTTMTGSVSGRTLKFSIWGRTMVLRKTSTDRAQAAIRQIEVTAAKLQQAELFERAQSGLRRLKQQSDAFAKEIDRYGTWFSNQSDNYSNLLNEGRILNDRVRRFQSRGIRTEAFYSDHEALFGVREKVWAIDASVARINADIKRKWRGVEDATKQMISVCNAATRNDIKRVCSEAQAVASQNESAIGAALKSYDDMMRHRNAMDF